MQVKEIDTDTGKVKGTGDFQKKIQIQILGWFYHFALLYCLNQNVAQNKNIARIAKRCPENITLVDKCVKKY